MPFGNEKQIQEQKADLARAAGAPQPKDPGDDFAAGLEKALTESLAAHEDATTQAAPPAPDGAAAPGLPSGDGAPPPVGADPTALSPPGAAAQSEVAGSQTPDPVIEALRRVDPNLAAKYTSGEEALRGFAHAQSYLGQKSQLEQLGEFVQANPYAAYERLRNVFSDPQQQAPQPIASPAPAKTEESKAEFDPLWLKSAVRDPQTGKWQDLPGGIPGAAQSLEKYENDYVSQQRAALNDPLSNPRVRKAIEEKYVSRDEFAKLSQQIQAQSEQQQALSTVNRLSSKLFVDPAAGWQGGSMRTAWGDMFVGKLAEAGELGVGYNPKTGSVNYDLQNRWAEQQADLLYAYAATASQLQSPQPAQAAQPVPAAQPRKIPPALASGGGSVPAAVTDNEGLPPAGDQDRLEALLSRRLAGAMERGEISQSQLSAFSR